jgi:serine/threonine protein kinase
VTPRSQTHVRRVCCPQCGRILKGKKPLRVGSTVKCSSCHRVFPVVEEARPEGAGPEAGNEPVGRGGTVDSSGHSTVAPPPALVRGLEPEVPGYQILRLLGRGASGAVYQARHQSLNRVVALKLLLTGPGTSLPDRSRFVAEAEVIARLHHSNIVQIYEVGAHHDQPFLALEFVDGGTLTEVLNGKPQPVAAAVQLIEQLALAIQHAHERHVLHRDLKPANVLLLRGHPPSGSEEKYAEANRQFGIPKITDFGLAKRIDHQGGQTQQGQVLGTPLYMAPEQAEGRVNQIGPASDVYALGVILYELLTGRTPFQPGNLHELLMQVLTVAPPPPSYYNPTVPAELQEICLRCLEKDPSRRYPTARALADALRSFLRHPLPAHVSSVQVAPPQPAARLRWPTLLLVVLATNLLLSLAWYFYLGYTARQAEQEEAVREARDQARLVKAMLQLYGTHVGSPAKNASGREKPEPFGDRWGFQLGNPAAGPDARTNTILVPFSFAGALSSRIRDSGPSRNNFTIYSNFPFPGRRTVELDSWRKDVLEKLSHSTENDAAHWDIVPDPASKCHMVRYAEVIRMTDPGCCECHNLFRKELKREEDWKVGDVRGVIEVTRVLDH